MASSKTLDINVISKNSIATDNRLAAINIDQIVYVDLDGDDVTTILTAPDDDVHTSNRPDRFKVLESLGDIIVKANNADFNNGLVTLSITKKNESTFSPAKTAIINRDKIDSMVPIYNSVGAVTGTKIKYMHWWRTILEVSEDLVTNTSSEPIIT